MSTNTGQPKSSVTLPNGDVYTGSMTNEIKNGNRDEFK